MDIEFVNSKDAKKILGISSDTTLRTYERNGFIKVYRPFGNRKRFRVSELEKVQKKR